ncbi:MAG: hypothetical protein KA214_00165 [Neisseriaceae bacterium]|nr:hypothetical protein [Neisseriaceae bacterium]
MSKIILGGLMGLMGLGLMACTKEASAEPQGKVARAEKPVAGAVTFQSDDDVAFTMVLPSGWTQFADPQELSDSDNIAFEHKRKSIYGGVAIYSAEDFDGFDEFMALSEETFDVAIERSEPVSYNGFSGKRYYFEDTIDGLKLAFVSDLVSNGKYYLTSQAWVRRSLMSANHDEIVTMFGSVALKK